jgi:hypothetical protein
MSGQCCGECGSPLPRRGGRLALFTAGFSYTLSSALLCDACHTQYRQQGAPGPNATRQAREAAEAEKNRKKYAPLVPGISGR